jgi:uncharacterized delta-60 repeat protein
MILNALSFLFFVSFVNAQNNIINSDLQNSANVDTAWIRYYATGQLPGKVVFSALTTDAQGNFYCTGVVENFISIDDYITVKYSADGVMLWKQVYNGPGNSYDEATCIAVDESGNVYVSGGSINVNLDRDFATIKYNINGEQQWIARYNGRSGSHYDEAAALALDTAGNIYVTGKSDDYKGDAYVTIKYDTDGNQQWVRRYDGPLSNGTDRPKHLILDDTGNIYITGISEGSNTRHDIATIKYDPDGDEIWVVRYDGPDHNSDEPADIKVDTSGNVFITGSSSNSNYKWDYITLKYDAQGMEQWAVRYDGPAGSYDNAKSLAVNDSGFVYVTGSSFNNTGKDDFTTIKYSPEGTEVWISRYSRLENSYDKAGKIILDKFGNLLVGGSSIVKYSPAGTELWVVPNPKISMYNMCMDISGNLFSTVNTYDLSTSTAVKFDSNGNEIWSLVQNSPGLSSEHPKKIKMDSEGNVIIIGYTLNPATRVDYSVLKYDTSGVLLWTAVYNGPNNSSDYLTAVVVDASDNIYVTGGTSVYDSNYDWATIKFNKDGEQQWTAYFDGGANYIDNANDIAVDASQNVYITGYVSKTSSSLNFDFATIKYSASGTEEWVAYYEGIDALDDKAACVALDDSGNVYVSGSSKSTANGTDIITIKYDNQGNEIWSVSYNGSGNSDDTPTNLAIDPFGNVIVCGGSYGDGSSLDYVTIQYDASGSEQWVQRYNGWGNYTDWPVDMKLNELGDIFITGSARGSSIDDDMVTIKYNQSGEIQWTSTYDGYGNLDKPAGLSLGAKGTVYVTGVSENSHDSYDFATFKINAEGYREWVMRYDFSREEVAGIATDNKGHIYVAGNTNFNSTQSCVTIIKYTESISTGFFDANSVHPQTFTLAQNYPNPFNPITTISYQLPAVSEVNLSIYNVLGQKVATLVSGRQTAGRHQVKWNAGAFASGVYLYKLTADKSFTQTKKLILLK